MSDKSNGSPNLYALLIGIDCYMPNKLPDGGYYPSLGGCVRDINHMEKMLRDTLKLTDKQIFKLTATKGTGPNPTEPKEKWPTYENIVNAFKHLINSAQAGDQLYIHYSGHGGRSKTIFPELKGTDGLDESLVPTDIGNSEARYLRDIEMSHLLRTMSDKGLLVTLVLDSCHSGGATRGEAGAVVRGIENIDTREGATDSLVAVRDVLIQSWQSLASARALSPSGWMPELKGYVLLAACKANELANEYPFDGTESNGALTYWLFDALKQNGPGFTYRSLYNRIVAKVHSKFVQQTPQIEGEGNREVFGSRQVQSQYAVNVLKYDAAKKRALLNTGRMQGVGKGAQFAIYPSTADLTKTEGRVALAELEEVGSDNTWAKITWPDGAVDIEEGFQAVLIGVAISMRAKVKLAEQKGLPKELDQASALKRVADEIGKEDNKWVRLSEGKEEADFQVAVNPHGEYEIWDPNGSVVPNLRPVLRIANSKNAAEVVQRLTHLTKYRNVKLIDNTDPASAVSKKLIVELGTAKLSDDGQSYVFGEAFGLRSRPFSVDELLCIRVTNATAKPLNVTVLDLQPDWGISQVFPLVDENNDQDYELLEAGQHKDIAIRASLPEGYQEGADIVKAIATTEGTSFRWLTLPALDNPLTPTRAITRGPANPLETLMAEFAAEQPTRTLLPLVTPKGTPWGTSQVEVRVRRPTIAHVHDPALSLLQAAVNEVVAKDTATTKSRSVGGKDTEVARPELDNPLIKEVSQYCVAVANGELTTEDLLSESDEAVEDARERGMLDVPKYCGRMMVGMAKTLYDAKIKGDTTIYQQYQDALTKKFGDCDTNYKNSFKMYMDFLMGGGEIPYRKCKQKSDFVIEGKLPEDGVVGIVADWGTGEPEAIEVLRQVKSHNPHVAIHLGDVYYAGTEYEFDNYFYQPWKKTLDLDNSGILSLALPGNHDLYAGGAPFYSLLDKLGQEASFFCLRNKYWQLIGLDTGLNDKLMYKVVGGTTVLDQTEADWLIDKIENADGRKTALLSHHQLFSANDQFDGRSYNKALYDQLSSVIPKVDLWLWGHEHDLVIFEPHLGLERGRCIGGSAFPVGNFEMPTTPANADVLYNKEVQLSKGQSFYQHCYVVMKLSGPNATVFYYEDRDGGRELYRDQF